MLASPEPHQIQIKPAIAYFEYACPAGRRNGFLFQFIMFCLHDNLHDNQEKKVPFRLMCAEELFFIDALVEIGPNELPI